MKGHLSLVKHDYENIEKRVLPRFPFSTIVFKDMDENKVYEVHDISSSCMHVSLKVGDYSHKIGEEVKGELRWKKADLEVVGEVQSIDGQRIELRFLGDPFFEKRIKSFLSLDNIIGGMRALHDAEIGIELPSSLKYWLRSDGPVELFIWQHNDREMAKFQIIVFENFIEWNDGEGIKTGVVQSQKDIETPLVDEEEFLFRIDDCADEEKIYLAQDIICKISQGLIPENIHEFLKVKIST